MRTRRGRCSCRCRALALVPHCEDLVWVEEIRRNDSRYVGKRQDVARYFDTQGIPHEVPPLQASRVTFGVLRSQLVLQILIRNDDPILHASGKINRGGWNHIYLHRHARVNPDRGSGEYGRAEPLIQMNQVARIQKDSKLLERKAPADDFVQVVTGLADSQQVKPLTHGLEVDSCKRLYVVSRRRWKVHTGGSRPARPATVASPVANIHANRVAAADLGACRAGEAAMTILRGRESRVTTERLTVVTC